MFFWDYNFISVTMNSSAYKTNNNSNFNFFSIQQWLTISTSSSPKLSTDTSVNTEMEILTIKLGITETRLNESQCEQKSFRSGKASANYSPVQGYLRHYCY